MLKHKTTWWQSKIEVQGKIIVPVLPFQAYDPFEFYYPRETSTRKDRSLPYLFLDVDPDDEKQIIAFCEKYGVLGDLRFKGFTQWSMGESGADDFLSRLMVAHDPGKTKEPYRKWEEFFLRTYGGTLPKSTLCKPMHIEDFQIAQIQLRKTIEKIQGKDVGRWPLPQVFAWKFSSARPRLGLNSETMQWVFGWDVGTLEAAMYLMVLFDILGSGRILTCPKCGHFFMGDPVKAKYCSFRCQNVAKVMRCLENKRKKGIIKKKGGSHGKTKRKG